MAGATYDINPAQLARRKALVLPREHGAWGMLLIPLATGAAVARFENDGFGDLALFVIATIALFWLRTPVESLIGGSPARAKSADERSLVLKSIAAIGGLACCSLAALFWNGDNLLLLPIGALSALAFIGQLSVRRMGRRFRVVSQMVGSFGLTSTAAGAYYLVSGELDRMALALWIACWMFVAAQIHYVQLRLRQARATHLSERLREGGGFFTGQLLVFAVMLLGSDFGLVPRIAALAFVPALLRGIWWFISKPRPLVLTRLGLAELAHAIVFGFLLTVAFVAS